MATVLTDLPEDVLVLVCLCLLVEDLLALMQTCRVLHALGSSDYLWRTLLSDWDVPLDIPPNASLACLPSSSLRAAAVKSLELDNKWRNPHHEMSHAQRIVAPNSSFVDGMRLLPGGRWLVTLQYEQAARTHLALWSTGDAEYHRSVFKVTLAGRARFLHAHHHRNLEQITIGVAIACGTSESIRVYNVFLQGDSATHHSLVFEATPNELGRMGRIAGMKISGDVMMIVFAPPPRILEHGGRIVCLNLVSRAAAVLECPDWSYARSRLKILRRHFAVITTRCAPHYTITNISFYELPSAILDQQNCPARFMPCWPEALVIQSSLISSTSWHPDCPQAVEFSDDIPTYDAEVCSFTMLGHPIRPELADVNKFGIVILRVSLSGSKTECVPTVIPCRSVPSSGTVRVWGRRAVWLHSDPDTRECTLVKFALGRRGGNETGTCISTLMPSFSGLPFNPRDFHSFVFDELSCKMAVGLPSGELYVLCS